MGLAAATNAGNEGGVPCSCCRGEACDPVAAGEFVCQEQYGAADEDDEQAKGNAEQPGLDARTLAWSIS